MNGDLKPIRVGLQDRVADLCRELLPHGRREGGLWVSANPRVAGDERKVPALKVRIAGGDLGAWTDFRNGRDGCAGDVIGLVAYLNGTDTKGALAWARDFLGLKAMSREERRALAFAAEARAKKEQKRADEKRLWKLEEARRLFEADAEGVFGSVRTLGTAPIGAKSAAEAHARAYFAARDCPLEEIATLSRYALRFSAGTEWWKGAKWETAEASDSRGGRHFKAREGPMFPAVHAGMRSPLGIVTCCHVTFLDPSRPAKAPVESPKLMFGEKKGAIVELATGPAKKPFWQWGDRDRPGDVVICEGIETGLSLAGALSAEARIWAAGDISNMGNAPVGLDCVARVFVARDNNLGNPQAQRQLDKALEQLEAANKPLEVMASHVGDDFNDLGQGE